MSILINNTKLEKSFVFSGGEVHIQLPEIDNTSEEIIIKAKLKCSDDVMKLMLVKEAIDHYYHDYKTTLFCPYFPYARQDRRCIERESFSLKAFASLIDRLFFDEIIVLDIHSDVSISLLQTPCTNVSQLEILERNMPKDVLNNFIFVSPDKGAYKKTKEISDKYSSGLVCINKTRCPNTGLINDLSISEGREYINGNDLLIVDDICDGGATFIHLVEKIKIFRPNSISLYVTHGIFSKGKGRLLDSGISKIYTTDSFYDGSSIKNILEVWGVFK